jgi:DNA repair protein RadC
MTKRLAYVGEVMGIPVVDHIITSESGSCSFMEQGLM